MQGPMRCAFRQRRWYFILFHVITDVIQKLVLFPREHGSHSNLFYCVLFMFYKCSIQKQDGKHLIFGTEFYVFGFLDHIPWHEENLNKVSGLEQGRICITSTISPARLARSCGGRTISALAVASTDSIELLARAGKIIWPLALSCRLARI